MNSVEIKKHLAEDISIVAQQAEALMLNGDTAAACELWKRICDTESNPRALAALILCGLAGSSLLHVPGGYASELATSREFIAWYQRLIAAKAHLVIERVNEQMEKLSRALPSAAGILEKAMFEEDNHQTPVERKGLNVVNFSHFSAPPQPSY